MDAFFVLISLACTGTRGWTWSIEDSCNPNSNRLLSSVSNFLLLLFVCFFYYLSPGTLPSSPFFPISVSLIPSHGARKARAIRSQTDHRSATLIAPLPFQFLPRTSYAITSHTPAYHSLPSYPPSSLTLTSMSRLPFVPSPSICFSLCCVFACRRYVLWCWSLRHSCCAMCRLSSPRK